MADKPLLAVIDVMPDLSREVIAARFEDDFRVVFADETTPADRHEMCRDATVLMPMWSAVDAALMDAAKNCLIIQKLGVGTDRIDSKAAESRGITVLKEAGINSDAVAEMAVLLTLSVTRHLFRAVADARAGKLTKEALRAESIQLVGRTVGLVGMGHIGRAVTRRFAGFGVRVAYYDPMRLPADVEAELGVEYRELDDLVASCDVISLHMPGTPTTNGMFDDAMFARFRRGTILINTARGTLINEDALVRAVQSGQLLGAGLDVTQDEPIATDSPLLSLDRVVVTPHVGGAVGDNFPLVIARAYDNVMSFLGGGTVSAADTVVWVPRDQQVGRAG